MKRQSKIMTRRRRLRPRKDKHDWECHKVAQRPPEACKHPQQNNRHDKRYFLCCSQLISNSHLFHRRSKKSGPHDVVLINVKRCILSYLVFLNLNKLVVCPFLPIIDKSPLLDIRKTSPLCAPTTAQLPPSSQVVS